MPENMEKLEACRLAVLRGTASANRVYRNQLSMAKSGAINALCAGEITKEQYVELTGEALAASLKERYELSVEKAQLELAPYVRNGHITAEEYQAATGQPYHE